MDLVNYVILILPLTLDVESVSLENISKGNLLRLIFKMDKSLLETKPIDEDSYEAKTGLTEEVDALKQKENH
ncbi:MULTISPECIES: hypothetical protein [unclassified Clostridium]|uniref:hypothetical protein n=1 Tax=unclassified Clostridium TaxID=2614128 RepID=UPI00207A1F86|nr:MULTISPECIES: hypothetical protein [unclassified Clostridium]